MDALPKLLLFRFIQGHRERLGVEGEISYVNHVNISEDDEPAA